MVTISLHRIKAIMRPKVTEDFLYSYTTMRSYFSFFSHYNYSVPVIYLHGISYIIIQYQYFPGKIISLLSPLEFPRFWTEPPLVQLYTVDYIISMHAALLYTI